MAEVTTTQAAVLDPPYYRLPDIPERHPDDMTSSYQLANDGGMNRLEVFMAKPETTIVFGDKFICRRRGAEMKYPDLGVAKQADPLLFRQDNGYIIENQGKTLDFVMEIASATTWQNDIEVKPEFYAELGIPEYWRFDETGSHYGYKLAGDLLVDGIYLPIPIEVLSDREERGYSEALGLYVCWRDGRLDWYDPVAEDYLPSIESLLELTEQERQRADAAELRAKAAERQNRDLLERLRQLEK